jgi:hypothetical protein|tara:strand:- start:476 stop:727 length:252 start_codon:yes stop_codon:yes gene_type:complete
MEKQYTKDMETIIDNGICSPKYEEDVCESYFSHQPCEGHFPSLSGDRYDITFKYNKDDKEICELSICLDCFDLLFNPQHEVNK